MGKWMVYLVNFHTNATSKRWHQWEIDFRFALNSTPGWLSGHQDLRRIWRVLRGRIAGKPGQARCRARSTISPKTKASSPDHQPLNLHKWTPRDRAPPQTSL